MSLVLEDVTYADRAMSTLNNMRILGVGCDAVLGTKDGGMFRIHKSAMSWCSSYFRTLFTTSLVDMNCGDGQQTRTFVVIPNVTSEMLENIIQYAYNGVASITEDNVSDLLSAADQFNVLGLMNLCTDFLISQLKPENCLGIWEFRKEYFMPDVEKKIFKYILDNFLEIATESTEFLKLPPSDLKIILKEDLLNVEREISVWNSVKRWIHYDAPNRLRHISGLLAYIRLAAMPIDDFQEIINDPNVFQKTHCMPHITQVAKFILRDLNQVLRSNGRLKEVLFTPRLPRDILVCFGGWGEQGPTNLLEAYDCRFDSWKQIETEGSPRSRVYHKCVPLDKYIYLVGGTNGFQTFSSCCRFHTEMMNFAEVAPMHQPRSFLSAVQLGGKIYAIGGNNGVNERLRTAEYFTPETNQWTYTAPMFFKRSDASACQLRNRIFIAGGFDGHAYLKSVEVYYVEFNHWCLLTPMNTCRSGLGCVAVGDYIYAVGGCDGTDRLRSVEKYDVASNFWYATKSMKRRRSNFGIGVLENKIYAMGGYDDESDVVTDDSECFDLSAPRWKRIAPMKMGLSGLGSCMLAGVKNVQDYTLDSACRSLLVKYLSEDLAQTLENLSLNDFNESQLTFDAISF